MKNLIKCDDCNLMWDKDTLGDKNGVVYCPNCDSKIGLADWFIQEQIEAEKG